MYLINFFSKNQIVRHSVLTAISHVSISSRLDMVSNVEEVIAQFMAVHYSNDPEARAVTVLAFGIM